ncbi:MAG TPA: hypothetical protein VNY52_12690 [Solirubrobacteraceae bacterium]|jgi:hypothetical protein|nr:hypothetical protein [Solirubrobacteraceae bacterium]
MPLVEQLIIDPEFSGRALGTEADRRSASAAAARAARRSLKAQVARLERELSGIVASGFPHISTAPALPSTGPRLLSLGELERLRDRLALRVREAQEQAARRSELEWSARELLERMKREPARYKFVRLPVVNLGERGCGVWEVRPRLGLIGMLAGWWQVKLSSGCPLPRGPRQARGPASRHHSSPRRRAGNTALRGPLIG